LYYSKKIRGIKKMPYVKLKPADEEEMLQPVEEGEMLNSRYKGHYSICQKLREIYQATEDPEIKMNCRIATAMAKNMTARLCFYRDLCTEKLPNEMQRIKNKERRIK